MPKPVYRASHSPNVEAVLLAIDEFENPAAWTASEGKHLARA